MFRRIHLAPVAFAVLTAGGVSLAQTPIQRAVPSTKAPLTPRTAAPIKPIEMPPAPPSDPKKTVPAPTSTPTPPAPPPAIRSRKVMTVSAKEGSKVHTVACEDGRVVTGGFASTFPGLILAMRPASDGAAFIAQNDAAGATTTQAICIQRPGGYTIVKNTRTLAPRDRALVDVTCPANTVVIGGGASTETGVYLSMSAPKLDGSAWSANYRSDAIIGNKTAETFAVCAAQDAVRGRVVEARPQPAVSVRPGGYSGTLQLVCPAGKRALSIGYSFNATLVKQPSLHRSEKPFNGVMSETWAGGFSNVSSFIDNVTVTGQLVAICADTAE